MEVSTFNGLKIEESKNGSSVRKFCLTRNYKIALFSAIGIAIIAGVIIIIIVAINGDDKKSSKTTVINDIPESDVDSTEEVKSTTIVVPKTSISKIPETAIITSEKSTNIPKSSKEILETTDSIQSIENSTNISTIPSEVASNIPIEAGEIVEDLPINLQYKTNQIQVFDIVKNITSQIAGENNTDTDNKTFYYKCLLGINNNQIEEESNRTYYEGYFAIFQTIFYNETRKVNRTIRKNKEIFELSNNGEEDYEDDDVYDDYDDDDEENEVVIPFIKILFYKDGSYKDIFIPEEFSDQNYNEIKEIIDLIIPKLKDVQKVSDMNDTIIDQYRTERKENKTRRLKVRQKNKIQKFQKITFIKKNLRNLQEGIKGENATIINSNESFYINSSIGAEKQIYDDDSDIYNDKKALLFIQHLEENKTKINIINDSEVYGDWYNLQHNEFKGSNLTKNITMLLEESSGTITEIYSRIFTNTTQQNFTQGTDSKVYNENNTIKEDINENTTYYDDNNEINVTNFNNETLDNINDTYSNDTDPYKNGFLNTNQINSMISVTDYHILLKNSIIDKNVISNIYSYYTDKLNLVKYNSSLRMLNGLRKLFPNDFDDYIIKEEIYTRNLEEELPVEKYYGLKSIKFRKNIFQTNFLGLDISIGLVNSHDPKTGLTENAFKLDFGDFTFTKTLQSFITNEPVITENLQQMTFKLTRLMYETHIALEERNQEVAKEINLIIKNILESPMFDDKLINSSTKYTETEGFNNLILDNIDIFQQNVDNFTDIVNNIENDINSRNNTFNSSQNELNEYIDNFIQMVQNNVTKYFENMSNSISLINNEIYRYKNIKSFPLLYENYRTIKEEIKDF